MMRISGGLLALCLLAACAAPDPGRLPRAMAPQHLRWSGDSAELPLDLSLGVPVIEMADARGVPLRWALDTGARFSSITEEAAQRLMAKRQSAVIAERFGDVERDLETVVLHDLYAGSVELGPQIAVIEPDPDLFAHYGVDGLLGINAFEGVRLTFDFPRSTLKLERRGAQRGELEDAFEFRWTGDPFRPRLPVRFVLAKGEVKTFDAILDTGSNGGLRLPTEWPEEQVPGISLGASRDRTLYGWQDWELYDPLDALRIGPWIVRGALVGRFVSGPEILQGADGLIGMQILAPLELVLDVQDRRGWLRHARDTREAEARARQGVGAEAAAP